MNEGADESRWPPRRRAAQSLRRKELCGLQTRRDVCFVSLGAEVAGWGGGPVEVVPPGPPDLPPRLLLR